MGDSYGHSSGSFNPLDAPAAADDDAQGEGYKTSPSDSECGVAGDQTTSLKIFRKFIIPKTTSDDGRWFHQNNIEESAESSPRPRLFDVSQVISRECFEAWVKSRKCVPKHPEKAFQRTLSAHIAGADARQPFSPEEEDALLVYLRKRRTWPCFLNTKIKFGTKGYRALGFHERQRLMSDCGNVLGTPKPVVSQQSASTLSSRRRSSARLQGQVKRGRFVELESDAEEEEEEEHSVGEAASEDGSSTEAGSTATVNKADQLKNRRQSCQSACSTSSSSAATVQEQQQHHQVTAYPPAGQDELTFLGSAPPSFFFSPAFPDSEEDLVFVHIDGLSLLT